MELVPNEGVKFEDEINKGNRWQKAQKLFRRTKREGKKKVLSLMMMGADDDNDGDACPQRNLLSCGMDSPQPTCPEP